MWFFGLTVCGTWWDRNFCLQPNAENIKAHGWLEYDFIPWSIILALYQKVALYTVLSVPF